MFFSICFYMGFTVTPFFAGDSVGLRSLLGLLTILVLNLVGSDVWRPDDLLLLSAVGVTGIDGVVATLSNRASCFDCCLAVKRLSGSTEFPSTPFCCPLFTVLSVSWLAVVLPNWLKTNATCFKNLTERKSWFENPPCVKDFQNGGLHLLCMCKVPRPKT